jgi:hypothetical protein
VLEAGLAADLAASLLMETRVLHERVRAARIDAQQARAAAHATRTSRVGGLFRTSKPRTEASSVPSAFAVRGVVDGRPSVARWTGRLDCDPDILARAQVVVALDEEFRTSGLDCGVRASLDGSAVSVLLTVMRAFSRVTAVEVTLPPEGDR